MTKKIFRFLFRTVLFIIGFLLLYVLLAFLLPYVSSVRQVEKAKAGIPIFIETNGVHTDFVIPVRSKFIDWSKLFPSSDFEHISGNREYVAIGWGDKGFFIGTPTWADLKFSTAFKAAFALSTTAMHVTYKRGFPKETEKCKRIIISEAQYAQLIGYMLSSFQVKDKHFIHIDHAGYTGMDCFYEANGTYSLVKTCNVWTGMGMQSIGLKTGIWTPLSNGVMNNIDAELPED